MVLSRIILKFFLTKIHFGFALNPTRGLPSSRPPPVAAPEKNSSYAAISYSTVRQGSFRGGDAFPLLKCLITHYGRHCEPFSDKNALDYNFLHTQPQNFFPQVISLPPPGPTRDASGAWTRTPICARLLSVPAVRVLRNDYWAVLAYVRSTRLRAVASRQKEATMKTACPNRLHCD